MNTAIIHTEGGGLLAADCPESRVKEIALAAAGAGEITIHLHGGLVKEKAARDMASRLAPVYGGPNKIPVFFVWETGFFETIGNNLARIGQEKIFKTLVGRIIRHVVGKVLLDTPGSKAATDTCPLPSPLDVRTELASAELQAREPYLNASPRHNVQDLTQAEEARFAAELDQDTTLAEEVANILAGQNLVPPPGAKSPDTAPTAVGTMMSPNVLAELKADAEAPGGKGLLSTAALIKHAAKVLVRVVRRFGKGTDHGVYTTVVEETLTELYLDAMGALIWGSMKNDARDTFANAKGAGRLFFAELAAQIKLRKDAGQPLPKINIVGHSAGTIFACHLLQHLAADHPEIRVHRLVFLAAACRCDLFSSVLRIHEQRPLWNEFRSFALSDDLEKGYWEVPVIYPRSLLYLVSGLVEVDDKNAHAPDTPLVGMERHIKWPRYTGDSLKVVRDYVLAMPERNVWSVEDSGPGRRTNAVKHGAFDDTGDPKFTTMPAVLEFLNS